MNDQDKERWAISRTEHLAQGEALREQTPWNDHSAWAPTADRPDPISLLQEQDASRVQHLVPIKYGRMSESAFAFFRGSAAVMAADLAGTPTSGLQVQLCCDAHLSNFGIFATLMLALILGFEMNEAASISIIGTTAAPKATLSRSGTPESLSRSGSMPATLHSPPARMQVGSGTWYSRCAAVP